MFQKYKAATAATTPSMKGTSPFIVLWREFFAQFFTSELVSSDVHMRQTLIWVLAFLLAPGIFLMVELFLPFNEAVLRAKFGRGPASAVDDLLAWIALLFTTYSMVSMGFITVLAWDALTFERRDAMVLGPLPIKQGTILGAKLSALGAFLLIGAIPINVVNATVFAFATADGGLMLLRHFFALLAATVGAGVLSFVVIVTLRAAVGLVGGPHLASACGPPLQFLMVVGLLSLAIVCPFVLHVPSVSNSFTNWTPSAWFAGLFEVLRGSPRVFDPRFSITTLVQRALVATPLAALCGLILSVAEFRRQMGFAVAGPATTGVFERAVVSRACARMIVGRDHVATSTADFILLTLARNRAQQAPIAMNAAIGAAIIIAALAQNTRDVASLMQPRTAVLWIPLVAAYWMTIGLRASFFVPSNLSASWVFRANAPEPTPSYWSAVRASMIAFILPRTLLLTGLLVPLLGWRVTALHAVFVTAMVVLLVEVIALTADYVPFTRPYRPGHAKLRSRWMGYVLGLYAFAYVPTRLELWLGQSAPLFEILALVIATIIALEFFGRRRTSNCSVQPREDVDERDFTVLDLSGMGQSA